MACEFQEYEVQLMPHTVVLLEQDVITKEAAQRLAKISSIVLEQEGKRLRTDINSDPELVRRWLLESKRRIDHELHRFDIEVIIEAKTVNKSTSFVVKFQKRS
jgi:hypothetical protein